MWSGLVFGRVDAVTQTAGRSNPDILPLKCHIQNVVVRKRSRCLNPVFLSVRSSDDDLSGPCLVCLSRIKSLPVRRPVSNPCVCLIIEFAQPFLRASPHFIATRLHCVDKVRGESAVFGEIIMPVPPIVPAESEIGAGPEHLCVRVVCYAADDHVDEPLVAIENNFH